MRKPIIAGNWKMHMTGEEAAEYGKQFAPRVKDISDVEIVIAPPYTSLGAFFREVSDTRIKLCAQNVHFEEKGAFTGEISVSMLACEGVSHIIIGHSERRSYFGETDEGVRAKIKTTLGKGLIPIMCVGETLEEREQGNTNNVIKVQIEEGLRGIEIDDPQNLIVAYEPVWAIGTGKTASPDQAQEVHAFIRGLLGTIFGKEKASGIRILYGGSVKPANVRELMEQEDIDGGLVGGASLDPTSFEKIVKFYE